MSAFRPHLASLADQHGSRYLLLDWQDEDVWKPDRYIAEGLLPTFDPSRPHVTNQPVLIVINATAPVSRPIEGYRHNPTHLKLLDWCHDIRLSSGFHAPGGPVRMLIWCTKKETTSTLPRTIQYRSKLALFLEMTSHVEEIVSADEMSPGKPKMRESRIDLMSGQQVARRMQKAGSEVPDGRQTDLHKRVQKEILQSEGTENKPDASDERVHIRGWHNELQSLQRRFKAGEFTRNDRTTPEKRLLPARAQLTPEYARLIELERNLKHIRKRTKVAEDLLDEQAEIESLDLRAHNSDVQDPERAALLAELEERKKQLQQRLDNTSGHHIRDNFECFRHDRKAYHQEPPLLLWDQRTAEPLKAYNEEFHPDKGLCLLDVVPKRPFLYPMSAKQETLFTVLMTALFQHGTDNLSFLDHIAPGAFEALPPKVPALTDPSRGGERDLRDLPINRLTPEMAYGLTMAWLDWPFKPELSELLYKGSMTYAQERLLVREQKKFI